MAKIKRRDVVRGLENLFLQEDIIENADFRKIMYTIIGTLSENKYTISQTKYLFNSIIEQFERLMPVTTNTIK